MNRLTGLQEAKVATVEALARVDQAISSLDSASSWGLFDIFGGGAVASLMKRKRIQGANEAIQALTTSIGVLNKELADINMSLPATISDSLRDRAWDMWLDNIFTDMKVQKDIKVALQQLRECRQALIALEEELTLEIEQSS